MSKTKLILMFSLLALCQIVSYGKNCSEENDTTVYTVVDKYPVLIANGRYYELDKIDEFIKPNCQFPDNQNDCSGRVFISIVVEKDGTVKNREFERRLCEGFDENSMKIIELMIRWKPGIKDGKSVRTKLTLPVTWRLE